MTGLIMSLRSRNCQSRSSSEDTYITTVRVRCTQDLNLQIPDLMTKPAFHRVVLLQGKPLGVSYPKLLLVKKKRSTKITVSKNVLVVYRYTRHLLVICSMSVLWHHYDQQTNISQSLKNPVLFNEKKYLKVKIILEYQSKSKMFCFRGNKIRKPQSWFI